MISHALEASPGELLVDFSGAAFGKNLNPRATVNWAMADSLIAAQGEIAKLTGEIPSDIKAEFDVVLLPDLVGEIGFAEVNIRSANFALRPGGFCHAYAGVGEDCVREILISREAEVDEPYPFTITRRVQDEWACLWEVDGADVDQFTQMVMPALGKTAALILQGLHVGVRCDSSLLRKPAAE